MLLVHKKFAFFFLREKQIVAFFILVVVDCDIFVLNFFKIVPWKRNPLHWFAMVKFAFVVHQWTLPMGVHRLRKKATDGVQLRDWIGGSAEGRIHGLIHLVQALTIDLLFFAISINNSLSLYLVGGWRKVWEKKEEEVEEERGWWRRRRWGREKWKIL